VVALGIWRLPPVPMLVGLALGLLVYSLALNWLGPGRVAAGHREQTKD
jgi:H+/Cl- antiporter ClcA